MDHVDFCAVRASRRHKGERESVCGLVAMLSVPSSVSCILIESRHDFLVFGFRSGSLTAALSIRFEERGAWSGRMMMKRRRWV